MSGIRLTEVDDATIPTPPSGKATIFLDDADGAPKYKDDTGTVIPLEGAAGPGVPTGGTAGQLLVKDSGTDYDTSWGSADIDAATTAETDTDLVLQPDGAGGVVWGATAGGGSPAGHLPVQSLCGAPGTNTNSWALTLGSTPTNGNILFACIGRDDNGTVTSITQTGVTWTAVVTYSAIAPMITIWKGVVGSGASTGLTIAFSSTSFSGAVISEWAGVAGTLDQSATVHAAAASALFYSPVLLPTQVNALVIAAATTTSNPTYYRQAGMVGIPAQIVNGSPVLAAYDFPGTTPTQMLTLLAGSNSTFSGCIISVT